MSARTEEREKDEKAMAAFRSAARTRKAEATVYLHSLIVYVVWSSNAHKPSQSALDTQLEVLNKACKAIPCALRSYCGVLTGWRAQPLCACACTYKCTCQWDGSCLVHAGRRTLLAAQLGPAHRRQEFAHTESTMIAKR